MNKEEFIKEIKKLNIDINLEQLNQLDKYYQLLIKTNKVINLTTITEENQVYLKHFYDSITLTKVIKFKNQNILDIGTGPGFPGIVIKIFFPEIKIDLLDATTKKCQFLKTVIKELNLKNISVINARAEEYAKDNLEKYDIVVSRAVAPLKHLLEFAIPMLKINGTFIALKGHLEKELINIDNYYQKLSLTDEKIIEFYLPNTSDFRTIYTVSKKKSTPKMYPRTYSQIKKKEI